MRRSKRSTLLVFLVIAFGFVAMFWRAARLEHRIEGAARELEDKRVEAAVVTPRSLPTLILETPTPIRLPDDLEEEEVEDDESQLVTSASISTPTATPSALATATIKASDTPSPQIDALKTLALIAPDDPPKRQRHRSSAPPLSAVLPASGGSSETQPTATSTPVPTPALSRVSGQARGYVTLPLMHPKARAMVEKQIEIMLASEVNDLYLSVLVDGTFGEDFAFLDDVIRKLNVGGRSLTLAIYFASGPTMRRWDLTPIQTVFSQIDPISFRYLIFEDAAIRSEVKRLAEMSRASFKLNNSLNPANRSLAIVMLEDNLDDPSYVEMKGVVSRSISDLTKFVRNPCPGCYEGNTTDSLGDLLELHQLTEFDSLTSGDGFTLDGVKVNFSGATAGGLSIDQLRSLLQRSVTLRHSYFGLWKAERQGLGDQLTHPDDRVYEVPTAEQRDLEISLLREGLLPIPGVK